ncbi:hypothetical protein [Francisella philomiragia]|uniref:Uncharacterized protein n=1 Tax=Francisella philomiragia TaxID=28110 RepID=A0A0B6D3H1_9GAMM|nr:hypothetical protein [Francisella philomiragia]AJI53396.1 hypothetical protein LA55_1155 [Francisella philomiragia]
MLRKLVALASILVISTFNVAISATQSTDSNSDISNFAENSYDSDDIRRLESNAYRRVFPNQDYIFNKAPLSVEQQEKIEKQAIQDLSVKEGEALTDSEKRALAKKTFDTKVNQALNIDAIKTSWFNGFRVSETLTHAMLNVQSDTGDPLFMLQARQQGILDDNYIYFGTKVALIDWQRLNKVPPGGESRLFSYAVDFYAASTISKWFTSLVGFTLYQDHQDGFNIDPNTIYLIVGNLSESPFFGYVANSTVMYGNFDIVSNYVSTLTRTYFMQSGGNINFSYHTQDLHLNAVLLNANSNSYFGVTNAQSKSGVGFSLNSKYVYEMDTVGDYQFFGAAYSNVSGFQTKNGGNVGAFDVNYGLAISDINFEAEALLTDRGVGGINNSSSVSPNNIAGVPFFGSVRPSAALIYDNFLGTGENVGSWSLQSSYTATVYGKRLIPYIDYSQVLQNKSNFAYQYGAGLRYNAFYGSWLGLDYTNIYSRSSNFRERQNYLSLNYTIYL